MSEKRSARAFKPALNVRYAPESDRLLRCREMTRWANNDRFALPKIRADSVVSRTYCAGAGTDRMLDTLQPLGVGPLAGRTFVAHCKST